jgi:hypothetical protein
VERVRYVDRSGVGLGGLVAPEEHVEICSHLSDGSAAGVDALPQPFSWLSWSARARASSLSLQDSATPG